jgi:hypothetical protein
MTFSFSVVSYKCAVYIFTGCDVKMNFKKSKQNKSKYNVKFYCIYSVILQHFFICYFIYLGFLPTCNPISARTRHGKLSHIWFYICFVLKYEHFHEYLIQYSLKLGGTKYHLKRVKVPGTAPYWKAM